MSFGRALVSEAACLRHTAVVVVAAVVVVVSCEQHLKSAVSTLVKRPCFRQHMLPLSLFLSSSEGPPPPVICVCVWERDVNRVNKSIGVHFCSMNLWKQMPEHNSFSKCWSLDCHVTWAQCGLGIDKRSCFGMSPWMAEFSEWLNSECSHCVPRTFFATHHFEEETVASSHMVWLWYPRCLREAKQHDKKSRKSSRIHCVWSSLWLKLQLPSKTRRKDIVDKWETSRKLTFSCHELLLTITSWGTHCCPPPPNKKKESFQRNVSVILPDVQPFTESVESRPLMFKKRYQWPKPILFMTTNTVDCHKNLLADITSTLRKISWYFPSHTFLKLYVG